MKDIRKISSQFIISSLTVLIIVLYQIMVFTVIDSNKSDIDDIKLASGWSY